MTQTSTPMSERQYLHRHRRRYRNSHTDIPVKPALQVQAAAVPLAEGELELPGQLTHTLAVAAPVMPE